MPVIQGSPKGFQRLGNIASIGAPARKLRGQHEVHWPIS
jgi:hypothetical protein